MSEQNTPTTSIQSVLDHALGVIQSKHPNVPKALAVIIAPKKGAHGYFMPDGWLDQGGEHNGSARHEIAMNPQSFDKGSEQILSTLIHECAHALAHGEGVKDTSRQGRFHNGKFRTIAEGMGLVVVEDQSIGHLTTGLMEYAKAEYAEVLTLLDGVLTTYRKPDAVKPKAPKSTVKVSCECEGSSVTVPIKWMDSYGYFIACEHCGMTLAPVD